MSSPQHVRKKVEFDIRRSSMVAPSKPLRGFSILASSNSGQPGASCNANHTVQVVTGLSLPRFLYQIREVNDHPEATTFHGDKESLQHPNYTDKCTRLQSFKHWDGKVPSPDRLVDAGFYMIARGVVKCYSCNVVVQGWREGDSPIDVHYLYNRNCDFVKNHLLDNTMASRDAAGIPRRNPLYNEKLVIKKRVKEGSYNTSQSKPSSMGPENKPPQFIDSQTPAIHSDPPGQQLPHSLLKGSSTKSSDGIMDSPSREVIVLSERQLYQEAYNTISVGNNNKARIVQFMCKVCWVKKVDSIFLPCGHAKTCEDCARRIYNSGLPCYSCNQTVATV